MTLNCCIAGVGIFLKKFNRFLHKIKTDIYINLKCAKFDRRRKNFICGLVRLQLTKTRSNIFIISLFFCQLLFPNVNLAHIYIAGVSSQYNVDLLGQ